MFSFRLEQFLLKWFFSIQSIYFYLYRSESHQYISQSALHHAVDIMSPKRHLTTMSQKKNTTVVLCFCYCALLSLHNITIVWAFSINVFIISNSLCLLFDCHLSPCVFPEGSESITRESVLSGLTSVSSMVPIARFSEEEKKVSIIKAPHYEGIGPVDESGIPIAIRTVSLHANKRMTKSVTCLRPGPVVSHCTVVFAALICDRAHEGGLLPTVSSFSPSD